MARSVCEHDLARIELLRFRHRTFDYICDIYSQLEVAGSMPFDQTIVDRVIGVLGTSSRERQNRDAKRIRVESTEELEGTLRDDGHFMAHRGYSVPGGVGLDICRGSNGVFGWEAGMPGRKLLDLTIVRVEFIPKVLFRTYRIINEAMDREKLHLAFLAHG